MSILVSDIFRRAAIVLNDDEYVRWTQDELFLWLNDAAGEIVIRRPAARSITSDLSLIEGPIQHLPEGGIQLLDVVRNKPGRPIGRIKRLLLDAQFPDWYDLPTSRTKAIKHYSFEDVAPTQFYVYPPAKAGMVVEGQYSEAPPAVSDPADMLDLDRAFVGPLVSYILYRALAKDSEYANGALSAAHFQAFNEALVAQNQVSALETGKAGSA